MKKLLLIENNGNIRRYELMDGRIVTIDISDDNEINIEDALGNKIGQILLSYRDDGVHSSEAYYHITWMYMDLHNKSFKHHGIGREALIFFKETYGLRITASYNDGNKLDDGSHLTGDAPFFVQKMRDEGVIDN